MDKDVKRLLCEVARAVLKVLDEPERRQEPLPLGEPAAEVKPCNKRVLGVVAKLNDELAAQAAKVKADDLHARGDHVRFWDGNRYVVGTVVNLCRKKVGQPDRVNVRVERGEGRRGKTHTIEAAKAQRV